MTESEKTLSEVQSKLKELEFIIQDLPAGYRYKVRELSSCIETVVSMYDDVQRGVIPDVLREMREASEGSVPKMDNETPSTEIAPGKLQIGGTVELI